MSGVIACTHAQSSLVVAPMLVRFAEDRMPQYWYTLGTFNIHCLRQLVC